MKKIRRDKRGYTLVELMVVISIITILASFSTPVFTGYLKKAKTSGYLVNCRALHMAAEAYFSETAGWKNKNPDLTKLEETMEELTDLDVEILANARSGLGKKYGIIVTESASGEWICEEILCEIDGSLWSYRMDDGEWKEME